MLEDLSYSKHKFAFYSISVAAKFSTPIGTQMCVFSIKFCLPSANDGFALADKNRGTLRDLTLPSSDLLDSNRGFTQDGCPSYVIATGAWHCCNGEKTL